MDSPLYSLAYTFTKTAPYNFRYVVCADKKAAKECLRQLRQLDQDVFWAISKVDIFDGNGEILPLIE